MFYHKVDFKSMLSLLVPLRQLLPAAAAPRCGSSPLLLLLPTAAPPAATAAPSGKCALLLLLPFLQLPATAPSCCPLPLLLPPAAARCCWRS